MFAVKCRFLSDCKYWISAAMFSMFIFFQLWQCFIICDCLSRLNWVKIEWWSESFFRLEFMQQFITHCFRSAVLNMRFIVNDYFLFFHVIMFDRMRSCRLVSLTMWSNLSVMLCLMKHCESFQIEWWRLKFFNKICLFNFLSNSDNLKMSKFWSMWM